MVYRKVLIILIGLRIQAPKKSSLGMKYVYEVMFQTTIISIYSYFTVLRKPEATSDEKNFDRSGVEPQVDSTQEQRLSRLCSRSLRGTRANESRHKTIENACMDREWSK